MNILRVLMTVALLLFVAMAALAGKGGGLRSPWLWLGGALALAVWALLRERR